MDKLSPARRSANMRSIKSCDTRPEMIVRRLIHRMGYRYRLHGKKLPGKPDIVFSSRRKVIFVHGCFWHQHSEDACLDSRIPQSNKEYWLPKLTRNKNRDKEMRELLSISGWKVMVIWECETRDMRHLEEEIQAFLTS